jgi:hypothetical protein
MPLHSVLARQLGLTAAATMALGLAVASDANADGPPSASASVSNDTLTVLGTNQDDVIRLAVSAADPNSLVIDFGNGTRPETFDRSTFTGVSVFLGSGDDQFGVALGGGTLTGDALSVDGGNGNDSIAGGDGNDVLSGGSGDDNIQGGDGVDLIFGGRGDDVVDGNRGNDIQLLGSGSDSAVWLPGEGSDVVEGGRGADTLVFDGAPLNEKIALSANGDHALLVRDLGGIRMDLDGVEQVNVAALGGSDTVTVNDLSGTDVRRANVDLSAGRTGDGAPDVVTVNGTDAADRIHVAAYGTAVEVSGLSARTSVTGSDVIDQLQVNGQGGNDSIAVDKDATALIGVAVDLGTGQR